MLSEAVQPDGSEKEEDVWLQAQLVVVLGKLWMPIGEATVCCRGRG